MPGPVEMRSPSQAGSLSTAPSQTPLRMFAAQSEMCFSNSSAIMNCLLKTSHESKRAALGTTDESIGVPTPASIRAICPGFRSFFSAPSTCALGPLKLCQARLAALRGAVCCPQLITAGYMLLYIAHHYVPDTLLSVVQK